MKKIFCDINLFDIEQKIFLIDTLQPSLDVVLGFSDIKDLGKKISAINAQSAINDILLVGNEKLCQPIVEEILAHSKMEYNKEDIKIQIIKKGDNIRE